MIPAQTIKNLKECERRGKHILSKQSELSKSCKGYREQPLCREIYVEQFADQQSRTYLLIFAKVYEYLTKKVVRLNQHRIRNYNS